jgi:hypothetical protein
VVLSTRTEMDQCCHQHSSDIAFNLKVKHPNKKDIENKLKKHAKLFGWDHDCSQKNVSMFVILLFKCGIILVQFNKHTYR